MDAHAVAVLGYEEVKVHLAGLAQSILGRSVIERLRPSSDRNRLQASLEQVDEARRLLDRQVVPPFGGLADVMARVRAGHVHSRGLEPPELHAVRQLIQGAHQLRQFFQSQASLTPSLLRLVQKLPDLGPLVVAIDDAIEPPGEVKDHASPLLFDLRQRIRDLEDKVRVLMNELATGPRYRTWLQEKVFSVRNGRYVLPVRLDQKGYVPGILHDKSASGSTAFVEPREVIPLANDLAEAELDASKEIARILLELSKRVYADEAAIATTQEVCAWLDFTWARARQSQALGCTSPRLATDRTIRLRLARHPLLAIAHHSDPTRPAVVPFSLTLGEEHRLIVVTGPNTGGKTVLLKAVGLFQLMFQSGLHVPVGSGSELPCLDGVWADIGDEQSIAQNLSTFSGHITQVAAILRQATPHSLVLLDELGAGTDPTEGAALGEALLSHLLQSGHLVIVTTHLSTLKEFGFSREGAENACMTFDTESLMPTYGLLVGQPGSSQALAIAARYGLPEAVISLAKGLVSAQAARTDSLMTDLMKSRVRAEAARQRSEDLVQASEERLARAEGALKEAEAARDRVEREAESEILRIFESLREAARPHLNALKNVPKALLPNLLGLEQSLERHARMTPFQERRRSFLKDLKKYDEVYVPKYQQIARIEKMNRAEERLSVKIGAMTLEIGFDDVSWVTPPDAKRTN